jgi:hypothetical protein
MCPFFAQLSNLIIILPFRVLITSNVALIQRCSNTAGFLVVLYTADNPMQMSPHVKGTKVHVSPPRGLASMMTGKRQVFSFVMHTYCSIDKTAFIVFVITIYVTAQYCKVIVFIITRKEHLYRTMEACSV